mgnify:CR=1 FL=1
MEINVVVEAESEDKAREDCQLVCDSMLCHDQFKEAWPDFVIEVDPIEW